MWTNMYPAVIYIYNKNYKYTQQQQQQLTFHNAHF